MTTTEANMPTTPTTSTTTEQPQPPIRIILITYFRTASNLFLQMLDIPNRSDVLTVNNAGYFFFPALIQMNKTKMLERGWDAISEEEKLALKQAYQDCFDKLQDLVTAGEKAKKTILVKEHAPWLIPPRTLMRVGHGQVEEGRGGGGDDEDAAEAEVSWKVHGPGIAEAEVGEEAETTATTTPLCGLRQNPSVIPDSFFTAWSPIILVRHPALAFPSYYRMMLGIEKGNPERMREIEPKLVATMTLRWTRELYEWLAANWEQHEGISKAAGGHEPIVLDADDFQREPKLIERLCEKIGLDASLVRSTWNPATEEEMQRENPFWKHSKTTLFGSSGIVLGKTFEGRSLEGEVVKWVEEFGEDVAMKLKAWVVDAMEDYEYLKSKRLTL